MVFKRYIEQSFVDGFQERFKLILAKLVLSQLKSLGTFQIFKKITPLYMNVSMELCCYPQSLPWLRLVTCPPKGFSIEQYERGGSERKYDYDKHTVSGLERSFLPRSALRHFRRQQTRTNCTSRRLSMSNYCGSNTM